MTRCAVFLCGLALSLTGPLAGCVTASSGQSGVQSSADPSVAGLPSAQPPAEGDVDKLMGVSRETLRDMLGPSTFTRRDGPAEIWRYATDDCFLTLFLHRGDQPRNGTLTVQYIEAHPRTAAARAWVTKRNCYGQILEARGLVRSS
ncbi:MAG: hypothetical protein JNK67_27545 [Alphaproteobacteria bacterium]|nr:hypothetical protein [Alphaproteobacteria bacterium]